MSNKRTNFYEICTFINKSSSPPCANKVLVLSLKIISRIKLYITHKHITRQAIMWIVRYHKKKINGKWISKYIWSKKNVLLDLYFIRQQIALYFICGKSIWDALMKVWSFISKKTFLWDLYFIRRQIDWYFIWSQKLLRCPNECLEFHYKALFLVPTQNRRQSFGYVLMAVKISVSSIVSGSNTKLMKLLKHGFWQIRS